MKRSGYCRMMQLLVTAVLVVVCSVAAAARAMAPGFATTTLPANDDESTSAITLPFSINFFGTTYTQVYLNNNGNLTFGGSLSSFTPQGIVTSQIPIIAPFWADVDTRGTGSGLAAYGTSTFNGRPAFGATWTNVGYYGEHTDLLNTFQVILVDRSDLGAGNFDIYFNYGQIQWETGDASDGVFGFGGEPAHVGYSNGAPNGSYELPGSGITRTFEDNATGALVRVTNDGNPGQLLFPVRNGQIVNPLPVITSLFPGGAVAGGAAATVTVNGTGFVAPSVVNVNSVPRTTTVVNGINLSFPITAQEIANQGTLNVTVVNPSGPGGGGGTSNIVPFLIVRALTDNPGTAPASVDTRVPVQTNSTGSPNATLVPNCGSHSVAHGVWLRYTAPSDGTVSVDLTGSTYQILLSLWFSTGPGLFQSQACTEGTTGISRTGQRVILAPKLSLPVSAGQDVWTLVTATNGDGGSLQASTTFRSAGPVPAATYTTMMPHVVTGGGYVTKLTIVNMAGAQNAVGVNFVANDGTVNSSVTRQLAPGETMRVATDESARNGPIATQWASITAQGLILANLFFEITDGSGTNNTIINTVGFNNDAGAASFTIPVEFEPGTQAIPVGRTVGLALSNPNNVPVQVNLLLRNNAGATLGSSGVSLPAYGHTQRALNSDFQASLPASNFIGAVTGTTSPVLPVNVVALGDDLGPFFATPPMVGNSRLIVPHIVTGKPDPNGSNGYVTKLLLVNQANAPNNVTITYYNQNGTIANPFGLPTTGISIPANASVRIATPESGRFGALTVQWAQITSSLQLGVNLFFEIQDSAASHQVINTIGFNNSPELTDFTVPVELAPAPGTPAGDPGRTAALAIANANGGVANVTLTLLNPDGTVLATTQHAVPANNQLLVSLNNEFQAQLPSSNFIGALVVHSSIPVAAIALEDDHGPFSAMPIVSGHP